MISVHKNCAATSALLAGPGAQNGIGAMAGYERTSQSSHLVCSTLESSGFVAQPSKSVSEPSQCVVWLGFVVNLALGQIQVPDAKIVALRSMLHMLG